MHTWKGLGWSTALIAALLLISASAAANVNEPREVTVTGGEIVSFTEANAGEVITLKANQVALIQMEGVRGTGYSWSLASSLDGKVVLAAEDYVEHRYLPGTTGTYMAYVYGAAAGEVALQFGYKRTFEPNAVVTKTFRFKSEGAFTGTFTIAPPPAYVRPKLERDMKMARQLPDEFNWCGDDGIVCTPPKNQGQCGSCWAFAAGSVAETQLYQASGGDDGIDISEQYGLNCTSWGCGGGWYWDVFALWADQGGCSGEEPGFVMEDQEPYTASEASCTPGCPYDKYDVAESHAKFQENIRVTRRNFCDQQITRLDALPDFAP